MTDIEISKALALSIGWRMTNVIPNPMYPDNLQCWVWVGHAWKLFDYRDWNVIGPIAAKYDHFPVRNMFDGWRAWGTGFTADTPQKAVALAVIGAQP